ncbi:MAG: PLD nuclease N-terminal domain-containing protein [Paenibacillaceae bacterium]
MEDILSSIPWAIIAPILVLQFILMLVALISCIRQETTNGPKALWIVLILFVNVLGPILYFVIGRRQN